MNVSEEPGDETALTERLADYAHDAWSRWMSHLISCSIENEDGSLTIPDEKVNRWKRQLSTPYEKLSDEEQESDRVEARKMIARYRDI